MKLNISLLRRIFWPERASLFVIIGGAAGMAGDMTSFFTDIISPAALTGIFGAVAAVCILLCMQRALLADSSKPEEVDKVVNCGVCDAMRFSLFAVAAFTLLLLIGQGRSATENIGEALGLIRKDVQQISSEVSGLGDIMQSQKLVSNPKTAEDFFRNAWIQSNIHRNPAEAFAAMEKLYEKFGPRKLDAAEMFYNTGRQVKSRDELLRQMEGIADRHKDTTLLIVAARNAGTEDEARQILETARVMDPSYPFAWWDIQNSHLITGRAGRGLPEMRAGMERQVADLEKFIELMDGRPAAQFFFLPQYQGDHDMMARQNLANARNALQSLRDSEERMQRAQERRPTP